MTKAVEHLQEIGGARGQLRPRVEGQSLKVAETILKKRQRDLQESAERAKHIRQLKKGRKSSLKANTIKSAQYFVNKAVTAMKDRKRVHVQHNRTPKQQRESKARIYCVVRNHRKGGCKETRDALASLGLTKPYSCTLIANDEAATTTLRKVGPFVFYGLPSQNTIKRLFLTRARMNTEEGVESVPLSDNVMIEEAFASFGILCLEDLLHEIITCGPHFSQIMKKIGVFKLANIKITEGLEAKRMEYGFLGRKIDLKVTQLT